MNKKSLVILGFFYSIRTNYSTSFVLVFVTVTLSVVPLVLLLRLPFTKATISKINTPPPTTHTHGSAYQVCVSDFIVVVVVDVVALSCAHARAFVTVNTHNIKACLKNLGLINFFKFLLFWVKKYVVEGQPEC